MSDQPREFRRFSWFTLNCILIGLTSEGLGILIGFTFKNTVSNLFNNLVSEIGYICREIKLQFTLEFIFKGPATRN